jgi:hypothetical protein
MVEGTERRVIFAPVMKARANQFIIRGDGYDLIATRTQ